MRIQHRRPRILWTLESKMRKIYGKRSQSAFNHFCFVVTTRCYRILNKGWNVHVEAGWAGYCYVNPTLAAQSQAIAHMGNAYMYSQRSKTSSMRRDRCKEIENNWKMG